jgi:putative phosphoesterase
VGVVSDTHGWLHPSLLTVLNGVEVILHAGDVVGRWVLDELGRVAPVLAVRGNNDEGKECGWLPLVIEGRFGPAELYLTHIVTPPGKPKPTPVPEPSTLVVYGHSHIPAAVRMGTRLYFNPGAAGRPRFRSVPTAGLVEFGDGDEPIVTVIDLGSGTRTTL